MGSIPATDWELSLERTMSADYDPIRVEFYIPNQSIPIVGTSVCQLLVNHVPVNDWRWAGKAYQRLINFNGAPISTSRRLSVSLGEPQFWSFNYGQAESWELIYIPPKYFKAINLKVWRYIGSQPIAPNV